MAGVDSSPFAPLDPCQTTCIAPSLSQYIDVPPSSGPWRSIRGWQRTQFVAGIIRFEGGENVFGLTIAAIPVTTRTSVSRYRHGSLVTVWDQLDIRHYMATCFNIATELCPEDVHAWYSLLAGSNLNGIGNWRLTHRVRLWWPGRSGVLGWNPLASPPWDYGHFNVWVPRAWGGARQVTSRGAVSLEGGAIPWSASINTTGTPDYYDDYTD